MEVGEPEEGFLEGVAPVGAEAEGDVGGGGGVEGVVVGLEVVVHGLHVDGEEGGRGGERRQGAAELGEEGVGEGVEPVVVELGEGRRRRLLAAEQSGFQHRDFLEF